METQRESGGVVFDWAVEHEVDIDAPAQPAADALCPRGEEVLVAFGHWVPNVADQYKVRRH